MSKKRLQVHLVDVADVELHPDGTLVHRASLEGSNDGSVRGAAPAGPEDASPSASGDFSGIVGRTGSGSGSDSSGFHAGAARSSSGAGGKARKPTLRDYAKKAVKSLETEIIKDQKRIGFVNEIYDASLRANDETAMPFVSPLRRRHETDASGKDLATLRAEREALEAGAEGAAEPGPSSSEKRAEAVAGLDATSLTFQIEEGGEPSGNRPANGDRSARPSRTSMDSHDQPKAGAHDDEVEDVWLEAMRLLRLRTWIFLDDPDSSPLAYLTSMLILGLIVISSVTFCLETMSSFEAPEHKDAFWIIECICIAAFTMEYGFKLMCCPDVKKFVVQPLNLVDLISILPFYIELAMSSADGGSSRIFRTVRLVRVFRVIKLGSRSGKLQVVTRTMQESLDMLAMMFFLLALTVLVFATLVYFAERGDEYAAEGIYARKVDVVCTDLALSTSGSDITNEDGSLVNGCERVASPYKSIPDSFWWTMVTLMTVGYGDEVPVTGPGRLVACLAMLASVLLMALPISVIGSEFTQQWMDYKKHAAEISGRGRKAAPRFLEVCAHLKTHLQVVDEVMRKMRDMQVDIDERSLRVKQLVRAREKEAQTLRRKKLTRGQRAVEALLREKEAKDRSGGDRRLQREVEALLDEREQLRKAAQTAELLVSMQLPKIVSECLDKCMFIKELSEDDYELIVAEMDELNYRAIEWHDNRARVASAVERRVRRDAKVAGVGAPGSPKTPGRGGVKRAGRRRSRWGPGCD
jgi:potassium voltage-gated channel Shab-related subfamily B protein 2